jgi:hypothetical protein
VPVQSELLKAVFVWVLADTQTTISNHCIRWYNHTSLIVRDLDHIRACPVGTSSEGLGLDIQRTILCIATFNEIGRTVRQTYRRCSNKGKCSQENHYMRLSNLDTAQTRSSASRIQRHIRQASALYQRSAV